VREYGKRLEVTIKIILKTLVASQTGRFIIHQSDLRQLKPVQYNLCLHIKHKSRSQILGQRHVAVDTIYDTLKTNSSTHSFFQTIQQYLSILQLYEPRGSAIYPGIYSQTPAFITCCAEFRQTSMVLNK
jgi:hypothetical protein